MEVKIADVDEFHFLLLSYANSEHELSGIFRRNPSQTVRCCPALLPCIYVRHLVVIEYIALRDMVWRSQDLHELS
jgi:hypothetical protein